MSNFILLTIQVGGLVVLVGTSTSLIAIAPNGYGTSRAADTPCARIRPYP
jgi:hypothetical protein